MDFIPPRICTNDLSQFWTLSMEMVNKVAVANDATYIVFDVVKYLAN